MTRAWRAVAAAALVLAACGVLLTAVLFAQNANNAKAIQQQRVDAVRRSCQDTNDRHDRTIAKLNQIVDRIDDPAQKARARKNIGSTIALINALVPKKNCEATVKKFAGPVQ